MAAIPAQGSTREPVVTAYLWAVDGPTAGTQQFDAVLSEEHERDAEVTDHSVEQGVAVVDHVRPNPDTLTLEVFVSNQPIYSADAVLQAIVLNVAAPTDVKGFSRPRDGSVDGLTQDDTVGPARQYPTQINPNVYTFSGQADYVRNCYERLTAWRDSATLLSAVTPRQTYDNMVVKAIKMKRSPETGSGGANFTIELRQIRVVKSQIVDAPLPVVPRAGQPVDLGKKDPKPPAPQDKESIAHLAVNSDNPGSALTGALKAKLGI